MTRTIAAACFAAAMLSCGFASATDPHHDDDNNGGGTATAVGVGVGISNVRSTNTNVANGGAGGKGGSSVAVAAGGAGGDANSDAYSTSAVGDVANIGGSIVNKVDTKYIAPPIYNEPSNNTLNCLRTFGVGGSGAGSNGAGGATLGYSTKDNDCQLAVDENDAFKRGDLATGWALFCRKTTVLEVYGFRKGVWWQGKPAVGTRQGAIDACVNDKVIPQTDLSSRLGVIETQRAVDAVEVERLERKVDTLLPVSK